jgi:hypothetical protein
LGFVKAIMKELTEELPKTIEPSNGHGALADEHDPPEVRAAKDLASRYRLPYIDLLPHDSESPIDYDSFTQVPVDLMVRYQFGPCVATLAACALRWRIRPTWKSSTSCRAPSARV